MVFHALAIFLNFVSGLVSLPVTIAFIPLDLLGAWLASGNILAWATMLDPGFSSVTQQKVGMAYGAADRTEVGRVAMSGIVLNSGIALLIGAAAWGIAPYLPELLKLENAALSGPLISAWGWACAGLILTTMGFAVTSTNIGLQSSLGIGLVYLVATITALVLQIVLVVHGAGIVGIALANVYRGAAILAGNLLYLGARVVSERIRFRLSWRAMIDICKDTSFTVLGRVTQTIAGQLDAFLIARMIAPSAVPVFRATKAPADIFGLLLSRPAVSMAPSISSLAGAGRIAGKRAIFVRMLQAMIWLAGLGFVGLVGLSKDFVTLWVGAGLYAGLAVTLALAVTTTLAGLSAACSTFSYALGFIRSTSLVGGAAALLTIATMILLGGSWGMLGIAASGALGALPGIYWGFRQMLKEGALSRRDVAELSREGLRVALCAAATLLITHFLPWRASNWVAFILTSAAYMLLAAALLTTVSAAAREMARTLAEKAFKGLTGRNQGGYAAH